MSIEQNTRLVEKKPSEMVIGDIIQAKNGIEYLVLKIRHTEGFSILRIVEVGSGKGYTRRWKHTRSYLVCTTLSDTLNFVPDPSLRTKPNKRSTRPTKNSNESLRRRKDSAKPK